MQTFVIPIDTRTLSDKIRTALSVIMGTAELMCLRYLPCHLKEQMNDILMASQALVAVADELNAFYSDQSNETASNAVVQEEVPNLSIPSPKYSILLIEDE